MVPFIVRTTVWGIELAELVLDIQAVELKGNLYALPAFENLHACHAGDKTPKGPGGAEALRRREKGWGLA